MKLSSLGEFKFIDQINRMISPGNAIQGIGDDTAVVPWKKNRALLFTTDMLLEGVHFTRRMPAHLIGRKAIACSLSDIAAMGGIPKYAVVSLGVSGNLELKFVREIYRGMEQLGRKFTTQIVGGDTVKSDKIIINVAMIGEVHKPVPRSGARTGDQIFVTGPLGRSLPSGKHLNFTPRIRESQYLMKHFPPTAMIDISDGLAADLGHVLKKSRVGAFIYEDQIPRTKKATLKNALYDGEDFELLFTLPTQVARAVKDSRFTRIGEIVENRESQLHLEDSRGVQKIIPPKGFTHF